VPSVREEAATLLAAALWGTSFVVIKYGLSFTDPFLFLFLRYVAALLAILLAYSLLGKKPDYSLLRQRVIFLLAFTTALGYLLQYAGLIVVSAMESALLVNTDVIFVAAMSYYFLHEAFTLRKGSSIAMGLLGVMLLTTGGTLSILNFRTITGDILSLMSAFMWALNLIINKKAVGRWRLLDIVFALVVWMLLLLSPFLVFSNTAITTPVLLVSSATGIFYSVIPYLLWSYGLKKISATSSAIILLTGIFFAALFSFVFLHERLSPVELLGGVFILGAIYLSARETL